MLLVGIVRVSLNGNDRQCLLGNERSTEPSVLRRIRSRGTRVHTRTLKHQMTVFCNYRLAHVPVHPDNITLDTQSPGYINLQPIGWCYQPRVRYKLRLSTCKIYVQFIVHPILESQVHHYIIVCPLHQRRSVIGLEKRRAADRSRANWSRAGRSRAGRRGNRHSRHARETRATDSNRRRRSGAQRSTSVVLAINRRSPAGDLARSGRASSRDLAGRRGSSTRVAGLAKLAFVENASGALGDARGEDGSRQVGRSRRSSSRVAELTKLREGGSAAQESSESKNSEFHIGGMNNTNLRESRLSRKTQTSGETAFITTRPWTVGASVTH